MGKGRKSYNDYICQEVYVLVDEVKRQHKIKSTREAILSLKFLGSKCLFKLFI